MNTLQNEIENFLKDIDNPLVASFLYHYVAISITLQMKKNKEKTNVPKPL